GAGGGRAAEEPQEPEPGREGDDHLSRQRQRRAAGGHEDRGREGALEHEARPEVNASRGRRARVARRLGSGKLEGAMKRAVLAALAGPFVLAVAVRADEVFLKGGGKITGVVIERTPTAIVIETGPGRVSVPLSRVERVAESRSPLQAYQEKAAKLAKDDVAGWLALAQWADDAGLDTQARAAYETVLALDPQNAAAHQGLGNVKLGETWVSEDEAYRARGYVKFEGP